MKAKRGMGTTLDARAITNRVLRGTGKVWKGTHDAQRGHFVVVVSQFNLPITQRLLLGAMDALYRCGIKKKNIEVVWTPGAYEIPLAAKKVASRERKKLSGIICLGAVIRGQTPHFEYISAECARGIHSVGLEFGIPIAFGVLTTHTEAQALARAGGKVGNKGWDAAVTAVEMANLLRKLS